METKRDKKGGNFGSKVSASSDGVEVSLMETSSNDNGSIQHRLIKNSQVSYTKTPSLKPPLTISIAKSNRLYLDVIFAVLLFIMAVYSIVQINNLKSEIDILKTNLEKYLTIFGRNTNHDNSQIPAKVRFVKCNIYLVLNHLIDDLTKIEAIYYTVFCRQAKISRLRLFTRYN